MVHLSSTFPTLGILQYPPEHDYTNNQIPHAKFDFNRLEVAAAMYTWICWTG